MATTKVIFIESENVVQLEGVAAAAITPGQLLEYTSAGSKTVQRHSVAGGNHARLVAVNDYPQGGEIDTDYTAANRVQFRVAQPGDLCFMLLKDGDAVDEGDYVESDGNGDVQKHEGDSSATSSVTNQIVGVVRLALDLSGSSGADPSSRRLKVQFV